MNGSASSADGYSPQTHDYTHISLRDRLRFWGADALLYANRILRWLDSPVGHGILKCTLAYTLGSLATFIEPISKFLGRPDGKHVVATITVYFHPARSFGSMIEAVLIAIAAVAYAELVSILSMWTSVFFGSVLDMPALAHTLVLIVFIGGGFGLVGWVKQKMNNPLVNVGSTLASLAIISVVTKETAVLTSVFSDQKIVQIFKMLVMGITITTVVNLLVWRASAVSALRQSMTKASVALGDMLALITRAFLSGSEEDLLSPEFTAASSAYSTVYPTMTKNLREAKFERYFLGQETIYRHERAVVRSMETLAQSIGGLRSAANSQFALLKEPIAPLTRVTSAPTQTSPTAFFSPPPGKTFSGTLRSLKDRPGVLSAIDEASEESNDEDGHPIQERRRSDTGPSTSTPKTPPFRHPSDIFEHFIVLLGPSMKSLAYTLSEILRAPPFGSAPDWHITINEHFRPSLHEALALYNEARANALEEVYKTLELDRTRTESLKADFEEVAAACGHFSFSLQTFGEEMLKYLDVLDDLKFVDEHRSKSWHWMKWWQHDKAGRATMTTLPYDNDEERAPLIKPIKKTALPKGIADTMIARRDTYSWQVAPPESRKNKVVATLSQRLLKLLRKVARDDGKSP
jgi:hypothetical protein